jgi:glycosyltransferase involved in cell wall biosynthesis
MKESNPHLFVHLSRLEGLPVSVMEAMSMGVPCIATSAGGTSELVDSTVGALLPIEVSPQDVANAIREVTNRIAAGEDLTVAVNSRFSSMIDNEANSQRFAEFLEQQL